MDREPKSEDGWEFGEVARLKCPNKIIDAETGKEMERVWKVKCGTGDWVHQNGTAINHIKAWDVCQTSWGEWGEWGSCSSSCDGGKLARYAFIKQLCT